MKPTFEELLEKCRAIVMTEEEKRLQAISFAYGNAAIDNPKITRQMVEEAFDRLVREGIIKP